MKLPISITPGELWDRISILELKLAHASSPEREATVTAELTDLKDTWAESPYSIRISAEVMRLIRELREVNAVGWQLEDEVRRAGEEDLRLAAYARHAFHNNDRRSTIRRALDQELGVQTTEQKEHAS